MTQEKFDKLLRKIPFLHKLLQAQVVRYIIVGVTTVAIDMTSYSSFVLIGIPYVAAELLKQPIVLLFNYNAHKYITFRSKEKNGSEILLYLLNVCIVTTLSVILLYMTVDLLQLGEFWGKLLQLFLVPFFNYLLLRKLVFRSTAPAFKAHEG